MRLVVAAPQAGAPSTNYIHALVSHASSFPFRHLTSSTSLPTSSMRSIVRCLLRSPLRLYSWRNTHPTHSFKCIAGGSSTLLVSSGKGLVQSGSTFPKGRRRRKGENERGRVRVPGKPRGREGSHNGHNGKLDARHADRERGESRAVISKWMLLLVGEERRGKNKALSPLVPGPTHICSTRSTLALAFPNTMIGYADGKCAYKVLICIHNIETNQIHLLGKLEKGPPIACKRSHW